MMQPYQARLGQRAKSHDLLTREENKGYSGYSSTTSFMALTPALDFSNAV